MNHKQLRDCVIKPALLAIGYYSEAAEDLVFGTACVESVCGEYLRQVPNGPALGIFQMELATYYDIQKNYLNYRPELKAKVMSLYCEGMTPQQNLTCNLMFAAAMCRIHYLRQPIAIPSDLYEIAMLWKNHYNTKNGKGTPDHFIKAYRGK